MRVAIHAPLPLLRHWNSPTAKFCIECAKPLEGVGRKSHNTVANEFVASSRRRNSDASLEGERKTVTTLLGEIKSSMELIEDLDPEQPEEVWQYVGRRSSA